MCMDVIREGNPVARKARRCVWCWEMILAGEKHRQQVGNVYGELQDNRYHEECWEDAAESFRRGDCDFVPGQAPRPTRTA